MAHTSVDIANSALLKLGATPILSLDDATKEARTCKLRYQLVKEIVLRTHPWNCASKRVTLAPLVATPEFEFVYKFQLPSNYIRMNGCSDPDYRIEGTELLSDDATIDMKYVFDQVEEKLSPDLCDAIAFYLAYDIAFALTQSLTLRNEMLEGYKLALTKAKTNDSQDEPARVTEADVFLDSRVAGPNTRLPMRNWPAEGFPM